MKKLLGIVVLGLLLSGNAYADNHIITIQCENNDPKLSFLRPVYIINLEKRTVVVGASKMGVAEYSETEIILVKANAAMSEIMEINRLNGRYTSKKRFYAGASSKEDEKEIIETGICVKKEKAF